jgi:hypothetical protein
MGNGNYIKLKPKAMVNFLKLKRINMGYIG